MFWCELKPKYRPSTHGIVEEDKLIRDATQCLQLASVSTLLSGSKQVSLQEFISENHTDDLLAQPQDQVRFTVRMSPSTMKKDAEVAVESSNLKREKENRKLTCFAHLAEYHNKTITKLFGGNSLYGCYALAVTIFTLGIVRDSMYASLFYHSGQEATAHYAPKSSTSSPHAPTLPKRHMKLKEARR